MRQTIQDIEMEVQEDGWISWMSDWTKVYDLRDQGLVRQEHYPQYGHSTFYLIGI